MRRGSEAIQIAPEGNPFDIAVNTEQQERIPVNPVKQSYDLSLFIEFSNHQRSHSSNPSFTVYANGRLRMNRKIGDSLQGRNVKVYANKAGSVLVIVPVTQGGLVTRPENATSTGKVVSIKDLSNYLLSIGKTLPLQMEAEYREDLNGWVGKEVHHV